MTVAARARYSSGMPALLVLLALTMGLASAVQGATNGSLAGRVGLPNALLLNAIVVFGGALVFWFASPRTEAGFAAQPWYLLVGGVYGLTIIAGAAYAFPRLGPGPTTALMITAQLCAALALDHFGWPREKLAVTPLRLAGALFLVLGAVLVLWPRIFPKA